MQSTIKTYNLNVGYEKKTVVSNVDINGLKGQIICLLGSNGAGKSTILRTLAGLLSPVEGFVEISGTKVNEMKKTELARNLAVVLTDSVQPYLMTVYELIAMGRTPYTNFFGSLSQEDHQIIQNAISDVGAENLKDRFYSELSDGEKQKVMIARALVQEPKLIVLDEPTSHLDIKHKIEVLKILRKLSNEKNITVILSLHDIDLAMKSCQTILLVSDGKIISQGCPEDIIRNGDINKLYKVDGASFNEILGSVEIEGSKEEAKVLVVAGNATGANIFRALSKNSIPTATAILHENDIDNELAKVICSEVVTEKAFCEISDDNLNRALNVMEKCDFVIDSNFPVAKMNEKNILIIKSAISKGKIVLSLRDKESFLNLFETDENVIYCESISEICSKIN